MKTEKTNPLLYLTALLSSLLVLNGCAIVETDQPLPLTAPYEEQTMFSEVLYELGRMSVIYNAPKTNIQSGYVLDDTGASLPLATGAEIQRDISEIVKSTLNSIGGQVLFIEYDPGYITNQITTGYSTFENKIIPDVVVTGGITGFDRALETQSDTLDFGVDLQFPTIQDVDDDVIWPPSQLLGTAYNDADKLGIARISLDFNMKSFETLAGLPFMSTSHSMLVYKNVNEKNISATIFGPTFGYKGSTQKVQGRHHAVRMLVQSCVVHLVGRYLALPYWRLFGEEGELDDFVTIQLKNSYAQMTDFDRLVKSQLWLYIHGYDIEITGEMDAKMVDALHRFSQRQGVPFDPDEPQISYELFESIYYDLPLDDEAYARRLYLNKLLT